MVSGFRSRSADFSALCPPTEDVSPPLHRPITLPCGHTLSSEHISIPALAPLVITSDLPLEIAAAQQRQHHQRLNLWAGIMCPIPTCKRYAPQAGAAVIQEPPLEIAPSDPPASSGVPSGQMLASGVTYYPPPPDPPAYTQDLPSTGTPSPLLDICVEKTLQMVLHEIESENASVEAEFMRMRENIIEDPESTDEEDHEDPVAPTYLSQDFSAIGSPDLFPISHRMTKRRRNNTGVSSRNGRRSSQSPDTWPFLKELSSLLECDVCAMLLHEPVTTPCQHVSEYFT